MSEHTKEPWKVGRSGRFVLDADGNEIAYAILAEAGIAVANIRRIVACVNFCQGVSTEQLEEAVARGKRIKGDML